MRTVLVGRDAELAALEQELLRAGEQASALLVVAGPAGVGKTALVEQFASGRPVAWARAATWESHQPYAVVQQLVRETDLPADPLAAAARLVGGGSAVVVVDDSQWCDLESLQTLSSVIRHHPEAHLLVLLLRRTSERETNPAVLELLDRVPDVVTVPPLDAAGVAALATAHGVALHPSMAARLCAHTQGLPRHVVALLEQVPRSTWTDVDPALPAPASVAATTREQLRRCSDEARALVEAAAVLGSPALLDEATELAGLDNPLPALDEAEQHGLLSATDERGMRAVSVSGPMVAATVLEELGAVRRADLHRRAAQLVAQPDRSLAHEVAATPLPDSALAERLDELARARAAEGAWGSAAALLTRASRMTRDESLREARLVRAVDALVGAGDVPAAVTFIPEIESFRETPLRNAVLGYLAIIRGRPAEAEARLSRAWHVVNRDRDPEIAALICQRFVLHSLGRCDAEGLVEWADRAIGLVSPDAPAAVEAAAIRPLGVAGAGRTDEAVAGYRDLAVRIGAGAQAQRVRMGKGWLHLALDEVDEARAELESAVPTDFLGGSARISLWAGAWLARAQFLTGEWDSSLRTVHEALDLGARFGITLVSPLLHWTATQVHALRGDWESAATHLRLADAGGQDYEIMRVPACLARAQYAEARADYAAVVRALTPLTEPWAAGSIQEPGFWPWADVYANALVLQHRYDEAEQVLAHHEQRARERGHRSTQARLGYARGRLHGACGDLDASRASFENALELLEGLPLRYDRARVNFAFGQTLRRAGKRREADAVITTAREIYAGLGATTYVLRCDRELKAGGLNVARADRDFDELTPQEEAVSELVAKGLSNKEVATELFVSTKTVQYHLTRIYSKLGIRSRSELAALRSGHP